MPYVDGDTVNVDIIDHRIVQGQSGTWALALKFHHDLKGEIEHRVYITPKTASQVRGFIRNLELDPDKIDIRQLDPTHPTGVSIMGKVLEITVEEQLYKGKTYQKVKYINKPKLPISDPSVKAFFDDFDKAMKASKNRGDAHEETDEADPKF